MMVAFIFWASVIFIGYTYIGYPVLLWSISFLKKRETCIDESFTPKVSMIIAAYNEEKCIREKLIQTLELDYPKNRFEVIVASDGSTDKTDEIVLEFKDKGVSLIRQDPRGGKTAAQNRAVKAANGEILIFSDATTIFEPTAIRALVKHFKDPGVGCVAGREIFIENKTSVSRQAGFFWKYELFLRKKEAAIFTLIGVSGCIFAIRPQLYTRLPEGLIEDFALPLQLASRGFRTLYEEKAIGYEEASKTIRNEFSRKARIVSGGINVVMTMRYLLNPIRFPLLSFYLFSHKICRWLVPICMMIAFSGNILLLKGGLVYIFLFSGQVLFYLAALFGHLFHSKIKLPAGIRIIYHFSIMNFSALVGMYKYLTEEKVALWETVRD